jgi:hypothetical protein
MSLDAPVCASFLRDKIIVGDKIKTLDKTEQGGGNVNFSTSGITFSQ